MQAHDTLSQIVEQEARNRQVEQVPTDAVDECGPIRTGQVENRAGHPSAAVSEC